MTVIAAESAPRHQLPGTLFISLATPSRGTADTAVWQVPIAPGTPATPPHRVTREEVFVVLAGTAAIEIDGTTETATAGDAIVISPDTDFSLSNAGTDGLRMLCCLPVGGQVWTADAGTFTPPWAE